MACLEAILLKTAYVKPAVFDKYCIKNLLQNFQNKAVFFIAHPRLLGGGGDGGWDKEKKVPYNLMDLEKFILVISTLRHFKVS